MPKPQETHVRRRYDPDPIMRGECRYCEKPFYYKPSMGIRVDCYEGTKIKLACGHCGKQTYVLPAPKPRRTGVEPNRGNVNTGIPVPHIDRDII